MRVLVITPWFPTEEAPGSGIFNLRDAELLATEHEVQVIHLHDPALPGRPAEWTTQSGILVNRIYFSSSSFRHYRSAIRSLREAMASVDLIHTMAFPAILPVWLAGSARHGLPWAHTEHWSGLVGDPTTLRARVGGAVLRPLLRRPEIVVAVGAELAEAVSRHRNDVVGVIGNQVRFPEGDRLPQSPEARGDSELRLVSVGNLIAWKGVFEAIEALALLRERGVKATLRWAGTGPLEAELRGRMEQLGVSNYVELLGHVAPQDLSRELLNSHLFVLPTKGETFGVAIAEALSHGLPVVTSGRGGHLSFLPPQASRVCQREPLALAEAIVDLVRDPARWSPAKISRYAGAQFTESLRLEGYRDVYARAVDRKQLSRD